MAGGASIRWESDPLFSAAEVVQDSADRMESLYRLLMHEWKLVHDEDKENKLLTSIQYHKRDLVTAVETTKWQLEDFDRAVYFAASSDETGLRKNAISKHKQFINAIREQIVQVQKCLEEVLTGDSNRSMQWKNLSEPDSVGLALFLSGSDPMDHPLQYNSDNSIMERFFDSAGTTDEIIELEPEEVHLQVNDMRHMKHVSNFSKNDELWEFGSGHLEVPGLESSCFPQEGVRENGCKTSDDVVTYNSDVGKTSTKYLLSKNKLIIYISRLLNNFWFSNKHRFSRNSTKRRKDGEIADDIIVDIDGHAKNVLSAEQRKQSWMGLISSLNICRGLNCRGFSSIIPEDRWLEALPRRFDQSSLLRCTLFHMRPTFVVLITITILGLMVFAFS